jgi:cytidine deaminase
MRLDVVASVSKIKNEIYRAKQMEKKVSSSLHWHAEKSEIG